MPVRSPLNLSIDPGLASAIATMEPQLQVDPPSSLGIDMSFTGSVGGFLPSQRRRREGRLTAVAVQGQALAHWLDTHYRSNLWYCWQVQGGSEGSDERDQKLFHRFFFFGVLLETETDGWKPSKDARPVSFSMSSQLSYRTRPLSPYGIPPQQQQQNPRRSGLAARPLAMCHSEPL